MVLLLAFQCWRLAQSPVHMYRAEALFRNMILQAQQEEDLMAFALAQEQARENDAQQEAARNLIQRLEYLDMQETETGVVGALLFDNGYQEFVANEGVDRSVICALVLSIGLLLCVTLLNEHDIRKLLYTTLHGRQRLHFTKMLLLVITVVVVCFVAYVPDFIQIWHGYGMEQMRTVAFSMPLLANIYHLSLAGYLLCLYATRLLMAIGIGLLFYQLGQKAWFLPFQQHCRRLLSHCFCVHFLCSFLIITRPCFF